MAGHDVLEPVSMFSKTETNLNIGNNPATHIFYMLPESETIEADGESVDIMCKSAFSINSKADGRLAFDDYISFMLTGSELEYLGPRTSSIIESEETDYDANQLYYTSEDYRKLATIQTSYLFNESNPEDRYFDIYIALNSFYFCTEGKSPWDPESYYTYGWVTETYGPTVSIPENPDPSPQTDPKLIPWPLITVVLRAKPTFNTSNFSISPLTLDGKAFVNISSVSVTVSDIDIKYGGNIKEVSLFVGNQKVTRTDAGELTLTLHEKGTFPIIVSVIDSRLQETWHTLAPYIIVEDFSLYASNVSAQRIKSDETLDDEGVNAVISATFNCPSVASTPFSTPVVYIKDPESSANDQRIYPDWYENWDSDNGFSNPISDWSTVDDGSVVYGHITDELSTGISYDLELTPYAVISGGVHAGEVAKFNIPQSFYLLVGKPGGHGLGIGKKPSGSYLDIGMDIKMFLDSHKTMDQNLIDIASEYDDSIDENNEADLKALLYHALTWD